MKPTAIKILYTKCELSLNKEPKDPTEREIGYSICLEHMIRIMNDELFDLERDQIVDAWCAGVEDEPMSKLYAEKYFNENYVGRIK
jgi:hypothetical protein